MEVRNLNRYFEILEANLMRFETIATQYQISQSLGKTVTETRHISKDAKVQSERDGKQIKLHKPNLVC